MKMSSMATRGIDLVLDSVAWTEYFRGIPLGETVDPHFRGMAGVRFLS